MSALRTIPIIGAVLIVSAIWAAPCARAQEAYSSWFKYNRNLQQSWSFIEDPASAVRLTIQPKEATGRRKRIVVLYPRASSAYDIAISAILKDFAQKNINAEFSVINFELKDKTAFEVVRAAEAASVDLIFSMGSESSAWLYTHYKGGKIPIVTVCSKDPVQLGQVKDYDSGSGTNLAYTSLNVPVDVQMAYVRELRPNLKNIAILVDKNNVSAMQTQAEPVANIAEKMGVKVIWAEVRDANNSRAELERVVPSAVRQMKTSDPDLENSLFWLTGSTSVFSEIRTINSYAGRVPVVSVVPEIVTAGEDTAALAIGVSFESNARLAAIYGERVLAKGMPGEMKVGLVSPPDISISFLKTRQIGLRVPFTFFEIATSIYDYAGNPARRVKADTQMN